MTTKGKRKVWIWVGGILGGLILIIGAAAVYLSTTWKPLLTEKLKEGVYTASSKLYRLDFKDIHLNILTGSVVLDSLVLSPDTNVYNKLKAERKASSHLFKIRVDFLKLSRIQVLTAYFDKEIKLNSIILTRPSIDMIYTKVPKKLDTPEVEKTLYEQISKSLRSVQVGSIKVIDADFDYYNGSKKLQSIKHLSINVSDILVDSAAQFDNTRVLHAKNIGFELKDYQSVTKDKMYTLKVDTVQGSINSKTLNVKGFKLIPMHTDLAFSRKYKEQKDRYDLDFNSISMSGVDFIQLSNEGTLYARHLKIGPAKVGVFLNRELPPPNFDKGRNFPHAALKRAPIQTTVDSLTLTGVDVAYTEYNPKNRERGTLKLNNLSGTILNLTNDSVQLSKNSRALANLSTSLLGAAKLNVKINFNLTDPASSFSYSGHMGPFNMKILNPLSKSLGEVEIESGQVKEVNFDVNGHRNGSKGVVRFSYSDLKVKLLKEGEDGKAEKKGLLSFLANTILIKNDNPTKGESLRTATISMERVPQASFFNLMWKSVFTGIREIVGIGIVPMKPMEKPGMSKKEERQKKREARRAEQKKEG